MTTIEEFIIYVDDFDDVMFMDSQFNKVSIFLLYTYNIFRHRRSRLI